MENTSDIKLKTMKKRNIKFFNIILNLQTNIKRLKPFYMDLKYLKSILDTIILKSLILK